MNLKRHVGRVLASVFVVGLFASPMIEEIHAAEGDGNSGGEQSGGGQTGGNSSGDDSGDGNTTTTGEQRGGSPAGEATVTSVTEYPDGSIYLTQDCNAPCPSAVVSQKGKVIDCDKNGRACQAALEDASTSGEPKFTKFRSTANALQSPAIARHPSLRRWLQDRSGR